MDINQVIEKQIEKQIISNIDFTKYEKEVDAAIKEYLKNGSFAECLAEGLDESGVGYEMGRVLGPQITKALKKMKIEVGF